MQQDATPKNKKKNPQKLDIVFSATMGVSVLVLLVESFGKRELCVTHATGTRQLNIHGKYAYDNGGERICKA
jgi:hypothetical protein